MYSWAFQEILPLKMTNKPKMERFLSRGNYESSYRKDRIHTSKATFSYGDYKLLHKMVVYL